MNAQRRKKLEAVLAKLDDAVNELRELAEQEQQAFDNLPESLQAADKGVNMEDAASNMESAADDVENAAAELLDLAN